MVGTTAGCCGPIRLVVLRTLLSAGGACARAATGAEAGGGDRTRLSAGGACGRDLTTGGEAGEGDRTLLSAGGACARAWRGAGAGEGTAAGIGAGGSSPRLRIRTASITMGCCCLGFSLVGDGCLRAGFAGGDLRPAAGACFGAGDAKRAGFGGDEAAILGGGEAGLGWRCRRRCLAAWGDDAAKASRCILLLSASWDLSTAVAIGSPQGYP